MESHTYEGIAFDDPYILFIGGWAAAARGGRRRLATAAVGLGWRPAMAAGGGAGWRRPAAGRRRTLALYWWHKYSKARFRDILIIPRVLADLLS